MLVKNVYLELRTFKILEQMIVDVRRQLKNPKRHVFIITDVHLSQNIKSVRLSIRKKVVYRKYFGDRVTPYLHYCHL